MNEIDYQDNMHVNHLNTRIRVRIGNKLTMLDEVKQHETFHEVENEYLNCKNKIEQIIARIKDVEKK